MVYIPTFRGNIGVSSDTPYGSEWYARVLASGGSATSTTINSVNTFCKTLVAGGVYNKVYRCNLFCGSNASASFVPIIKTMGTALDTNVGFIESDYNSTNGLTGDGSSKYLNTGLDPNASGMDLNSCHLSVYVQSGSTAYKRRDQIGCDEGGNAIYFALNIHWSWLPETMDNFSVFYSGQNIASNMAWLNPDPNTYIGYYIGSRTAANSSSLYQNGSILGSCTGQSVAILPRFPIYVFAQNDNNPIGHIENCLGGYTIGSGLTIAEVTVLNNAMVTFAATRN